MKSKCDYLPGKKNISLEDSIGTDKLTLFDTIIADAYLRGVPDIHFEPLASQDIIRVFFRMDGVMRQYMVIPYAAADDMVYRIKGMANLGIQDSHLPKIGRIKFKHTGLPDFDLTATIRTDDGLGEKATLRIQTA